MKGYVGGEFKKEISLHVTNEMAELYVQYQRTPYYDRQSGMTVEVNALYTSRLLLLVHYGVVRKSHFPLRGLHVLKAVRQEYHDAIERSKCLYVGNLSYFTTEAQLYEFFSRCGEVTLRHCGFLLQTISVFNTRFKIVPRST